MGSAHLKQTPFICVVGGWMWIELHGQDVLTILNTIYSQHQHQHLHHHFLFFVFWGTYVTFSWLFL